MKIKLSKAGFLGVFPRLGRNRHVYRGEVFSTIIYWAWWVIDLTNAKNGGKR